MQRPDASGRIECARRSTTISPSETETAARPRRLVLVTWSVLAADASTGETAIAVASCVPLEVVLEVPGFAEGRGALVTQSFLLDGERERGLDLLAGGASPNDVIAALVDPAYDPDFALRQLAVVDLEGAVATFTGDDALPFAGGGITRIGSIAIAVQGNILTGREVVDDAIAEAGAGAPCDLPERVLAALEAGARRGGDARCTPLGRPAQSAALRGGPFAIDVGVAEPGAGADPLVTLRNAFDAARAEHPCPVAHGGEGNGGAAGDGGRGDAESSTASSTGEKDAEDGCGVATSTPAAAWLATTLLVLAVRRISWRRRSRP